MRTRQSDGKHACRLTFKNSPRVMVFPQAAIVEADPAFKTESNRWLLRLRLGGGGQLLSVCTDMITLLNGC